MTASLSAPTAFALLHRWPALKRFSSPTALLSYLHSPVPGAEGAKDQVYRALFEATRGTGSELAPALIWLGLWPALEAIYRRAPRYFPGNRDEIASEISALLSLAIAALDLGQVAKLYGTLTMNIERDLKRQAARRWKEHQRSRELDPDGEELAQAPADGQEVAELLEVVGAELGEETAALVVAVILEGKTREEAGRPFGLGEDVVRKRVKAALTFLGALLRER